MNSEQTEKELNNKAKFLHNVVKYLTASVLLLAVLVVCFGIVSPFLSMAVGLPTLGLAFIDLGLEITSIVTDRKLNKQRKKLKNEAEEFEENLETTRDRVDDLSIENDKQRDEIENDSQRDEIEKIFVDSFNEIIKIQKLTGEDTTLLERLVKQVTSIDATATVTDVTEEAQGNKETSDGHIEKVGNQPGEE